jgi:hypothetical protein
VHIAAERGHVAILRALAGLGANIHVRIRYLLYIYSIQYIYSIYSMLPAYLQYLQYLQYVLILQNL